MNGNKSNRKKGCKPETEAKYRPALELYANTELSCVEICRQCGISISGFTRYIGIYHRELMFARHGIELSSKDASGRRLKKTRGQTAAAHAKYKEAIEACDNVEFIEYNISQIAHIFKLNPTALGNQLRNHFPDIIERRERERRRLGINDNRQRGANYVCLQQYAEAVEHLQQSDDSIRLTAEIFNLSYPGLREHLLYYHKELVNNRLNRRNDAKGSKKRGELIGNGKRHLPAAQLTEKYKEAIDMYRNTALTQNEIAAATGISPEGLKNHLRVWNRDLMQERRDAACGDDGSGASSTRRFLKSTAAKYAEAIAQLKETACSCTEIARKFGLNADVFRQYLRQHEPEIAAQSGMTRGVDGRLMSARSMKKYDDAIRIYATSAEPLKSIAERLGVKYKSLSGFIRRNRPDAIEQHNRVAEAESNSRKEETIVDDENALRQKTEDEKQRIINALIQTSNNRRKAAKILGISKSTLYNKMKALGMNR